MGGSMIIGQYVPGNSLIHKLDPRTKLIVIFFYVIVVCFTKNKASYELLLALLSISLSNIPFPFRYMLKGLTPIWSLFLFTFILHLFVTNGGDVLYLIFNFKI